MSTVISNPAVIVNNIPQAIKPNSLSFTEGFGEQIMRAASTGGGGVEQILADDITDNFSDVKFALDPTEQNIESARAWKSQPGLNGIIVSATVTSNGVSVNFRRAFNNASLMNNYEVNLGADTQIDLEFKSDAAI